jgi:hypothetical protein
MDTIRRKDEKGTTSIDQMVSENSTQTKRDIFLYDKRKVCRVANLSLQD